MARHGRGSRRQSHGARYSNPTRSLRLNDSIILRGVASAVNIGSPASGLATTSVALTDTAFGDRVSNVSLAFEKWRILRLQCRYVPVVPSSTTGLVFFGIDDDVDNISTGTAASPDLLRCSTQSTVWKESTFTWTPENKSQWYFLNATTTGDTTGAKRLTQPATLIWGGLNLPASTTLGYLYITYEIQFSGAAPANIT